MRPSLCEPLLVETDQHHQGEVELEETLVNEGEGGEGSGEANTKRRGSVETEETKINLKAAEDPVICQVKISSPMYPMYPLSPLSPPQRTPESFESPKSPTCRNAIAEASKPKAGE